MKLIGAVTSPYVRKVRIVMAEKKLEYQFELEDVWAPDSTIVEFNPLGKVPCLLMETGEALYDSRVILEYLDHLAGGGRIIPREPKARFAALRLQALCDGMLDASVLIVYESRYRPADMQVQSWIDRQADKVARGLAALEAAPPALDSKIEPLPNVGQITLACLLGYRDLRFAGTWRKDHPRLVAWLEQFAAQVPAFAETKVAA